MRITFLAVGSRGDVNPACTVASRLKEVGYQVCVATHENFHSFVDDLGLEFAPIAGNYQQLLKTEAGFDTLEGKGGFRLISDDLLLQQLEASLAACEGSDLIISFPLSLYGYHIAEKLNTRFLAMSYIPLIATKEFPFLGFGSQKAGLLSPLLNLLSYKIAELILWQSDRPVINQFRQSLGLPKIPLLGVAFRRDVPQNLRNIATIQYCSPTIIPRPHDWSDSAYITGHLIPTRQTEYQPTSELANFIDRGEKPIFVGFGSMTTREPQRLTQTILEALSQTNQRAVLLSGWANLGEIELPEHIFLLKEYVPFEWLFARMKLLVHHGGSGTVALGLRSGIPQIIIPFFADQPEWGKKLATLGVAPAPIPILELTTENLTSSISQALNNTNLQQQAEAIAQSLKLENGIEETVQIIQQYLSSSVR